MTAATIWFGWWLCTNPYGAGVFCIPMKSYDICLQAKGQSYDKCINNETGERK